MFNFYKILFSMTLMIGSLIAISSYSWLSMWMGLEINLLSIIPLLKDKNNIYPAEAALKYFITQTLASMILLLSILLSLNIQEFWPETLTFLNMIMNSALLTKVGAAPFHSWFPEVLEGLNWINSLLMLTWQKIAPMVLIFYNCKLSSFFLSIILISTIVSGILGLNQISLRKILAYSSINHMSWMLASMLNSQYIWLIYFIIYSIISLNIILILRLKQIFYLHQLFNSLNSSKLIKFSFMLNFFSLGGLPPFLGFFPKWLVVNNLIQQKFFLLSFLLIVFTLITLFFYLRITFTALVINSSETLIFSPKKMNFFIFLFNFISLSGLLVSTLVFNYI
uniref:NADH-ubiquinone oxidoreductase chain 2 n=1 Tax=Apriona swainsoni TaxID=320467 RepID=A0A1P8C9U5_9CUCU|nr:NADH dehydrogenase subunit 2 [Apriona swainsoni]YP_010873064.1 NADH dehydrogenase subunit 2 [Batocera horsfieldi]APA32592.1 NADH dehydrogenase subunit 2 [Apriona swainsoni]WGV34284.1 NADH dehydrogenase subunit 2 [Batocera horsfieldi]